MGGVAAWGDWWRVLSVDMRREIAQRPLRRTSDREEEAGRRRDGLEA